jgi:type IV secretion system protein VirB9
MSRRAILFALALACVAGPAVAQGRTVDPRIRYVAYDADAIVRVEGVFNFQIVVEFAPEERIENVSIGDAQAWQVTPSRGGALLFLKPIEAAIRTNMTVVTDRRRYLFELTAREAPVRGDARAVYALRFTYPAPAAPVMVTAKPPPPVRRNTAYAYTGSIDTLPALVFDDGAFTYFQWSDAASMPALFLLQQDGKEALVNYAYRDGFLVVEQLARRFRLRSGGAVTTIVNQGWRDPAVGGEAPRPVADRARARNK